MRLLIADFDRQNIVSKNQVVQAVRRLPQRHYAGIKAIRYDPYRTLATYLAVLQNKPSSPRTKGLYYQDEELNVIVLFEFSTQAQFYHILYHEIGHYAFLRVLTQPERDQWLYTVRPNEPRFVSQEARQNAREDFAECYAAYCTRPEHLAHLPQKYTYFRDVVFAEGAGTPHAKAIL